MNAKRNLAEVGSQNQVAGFVSPAGLKKGQTIEGIYQGTFQSGLSAEGKPQFVHKIELDSAIRYNRKMKNPEFEANPDAEEYVTVTEDLDAGEIAGLNSTTYLANRFSQLVPGNFVSVQYFGKETLKKPHPMAGKKAHSFKLLADKSSNVAEIADDDSL